MEAETNDNLTPKQRLFVRAYLGKAGLNAAEAARLAGYSEQTAKEIGYENLTKPHIAELVKVGLTRLALDEPEVLARMACHARSDMNDFLDESGAVNLEKARERGVTYLMREYACEEVIEAGDDEGTPSRRIRKQRIKISDPKDYLVTLGKHHKLWTDKHEHGGTDGGAIPIKIYAGFDLSEV